MKEKFVLPGDSIANALEYLPSFGTYADEDDVRSSATGESELNETERTAKIRIATKIPKIQQRGTFTYGTVVKVSDKRAMIDLHSFESGKFRLIPSGETAILKVEDVKRGFVKSMKEEFKEGDLIKVKIINVSKTGVDLTTDERDLGVIKTNCSRCRKDVSRIGFKVKCNSCVWVENRKLSSQYNEVF